MHFVITLIKQVPAAAGDGGIRRHLQGVACYRGTGDDIAGPICYVQTNKEIATPDAIKIVKGDSVPADEGTEVFF